MSILQASEFHDMRSNGSLTSIYIALGCLVQVAVGLVGLALKGVVKLGIQCLYHTIGQAN